MKNNFTVLLLLLTLTTPLAAQIKLGTATTDITPESRVWLGGWRRSEKSRTVADRLHLRVAALRDSKGTLQVFVSLDLIYPSASDVHKLRSYYCKKYKQKASGILFNATHTHWAPYTTEKVVECGKRAIDEAIADMREVSVKFGIDDNRQLGISRRYKNPRSGKIMFRPSPEGYFDPDMPVFSFSDQSGKIRAVIWSYAAHPTGGGIDKLAISDAYPGEVNRSLNQQLGGNVFTMFLQGGAGDVWFKMRKVVRNSADVRKKYLPGEKYRNWDYVYIPAMTPELKKQLCAQAAEIIARFIRSGKMKNIDFDFASAITDIKIAYDPNHPKIRKAIKTKEQIIADMNNSSLSERKRKQAKAIFRQWYSGKIPEADIQLQRVRLNKKLQIMAHSGEPTSVLGRLVKDEFPDQTTIFLGYIRRGSYMASYKQQLEGGYEAKGFGEEAERKILRTFKELKELK